MLHQCEAGRVWRGGRGGGVVNFWSIRLGVHSDYWNSCRVVGWAGSWS